MNAWIRGALLVALGLAVTVALGTAHHQVDWLHALMLAFTVYGIVLLAAPLLGKRSQRYEVRADYRPFVSILIPARNEEAVIEDTVRSLARMSYSREGEAHYEILVIDDGSTDRTASRVARLSEEFPTVRLHVRTNRAGKGKSAVLNEGLLHTRGEVIAVFDADTRVEPDFLDRCIPYLADPRIGGVQTRVRIYNASHNLLTAMQEDEFAVFAHLTQLAKDGVDGLTALGGNGQLTRRSELEAVGGWNEMSTTEDLDLTLQLLMRGTGVRYCGDAVIWQEAVTSWRSLMRQRSRWAEGFIKCCYDYLGAFFYKPMGLVQRVDGILSLARVLVPLWMWAMYLVMAVLLARGVNPHSSLPHALFLSVSLGFFAISAACIAFVLRGGLIDTAWRTARYWAYNFVWMLAVPIGFFNGVRYFDTIVWDKTVHQGQTEDGAASPTSLSEKEPVVGRMTPSDVLPADFDVPVAGVVDSKA